MHLHDAPFKRVVSGEKKWECRLNDVKRRKITIGDEIVFINRETDERVMVSVKDITTADTFEKLREDVIVDGDIREYYSDDEILRIGVIAIGFTKE